MKFLTLMILALAPFSAFASGCMGPEFQLAETKVLSVVNNKDVSISYEMIERYADPRYDMARLSAYTESLGQVKDPHFFWHRLESATGISPSIAAIDIQNAIKAGNIKTEVIENRYEDRGCGYQDALIKDLRITVTLPTQELVLSTDYLEQWQSN